MLSFLSAIFNITCSLFLQILFLFFECAMFMVSLSLSLSLVSGLKWILRNAITISTLQLGQYCPYLVGPNLLFHKAFNENEPFGLVQYSPLLFSCAKVSNSNERHSSDLIVVCGLFPNCWLFSLSLSLCCLHAWFRFWRIAFNHCVNQWFRTENGSADKCVCDGSRGTMPAN